MVLGLCVGQRGRVTSADLAGGDAGPGSYPVPEVGAGLEKLRSERQGPEPLGPGSPALEQERSEEPDPGQRHADESRAVEPRVGEPDREEAGPVAPGGVGWGRKGGAPRGFVWAACGLTAASWAWYVVWALTGAGPVAVAYLTVPAGGIIAVLAVAGLWRVIRDDARTRRFWGNVAAGAGLMTVGYGISAANAFRNGEQALSHDMPVPGAVLVGLGFVLVLVAVAAVPVRVGGPRVQLDRAIAFLGCATPLWHLALAPMVLVPDPWSPQTLSLVGIAFAVSLGGITKVSYLDVGPVDRTAMRLLAAVGLTGIGVAWLAVSQGDPGAAPAQAVVLPVAPVLMVLAVRAQWRTTLGCPRRPRRTSSRLPYLAMGAVTVSLVAVAAGDLRWPGRVTLGATVVVIALVAVRLFLSGRENDRLLAGLREQEERLQHEARHDGLTGLPNRARFRQALGEAGPGCTVLLVDLDDFKTVNDALGHDVGDDLLVALAGLLREQAGAGAVPVRIGGDEFAVLAHGDGDAVARRILTALKEPVGEHRLLVQASIGIAEAEPGASVDTVLRQADIAMYAAKQRGKASCVRYQPGMAEPVAAHMRLGGELRRALDRCEFEVVYQPVMELATRRVIGVEALVRWRHPERGLVPPVEFVPAAERTGLIVPLGRFVLRETCRQAALWFAEFGPDALQKPGVNVSARQLHDPDFVADVVAALADTGLPADRLVLELTESAALRGAQVSRTLHELDRLGIKLALDDFGTGESSLSLLRAFPAAIVKLDKSFVDGIELEDPDPAVCEARQAVARAVVQLAAALRLDTVAEGIENQAQADRLRALGYTLGQGYHLAAPMSAAAMTGLLASQAAMTTA